MFFSILILRHGNVHTLIIYCTWAFFCQKNHAPRKRWNFTLLFNFTTKMLMFPFKYKFCKHMSTTAVPKISPWHYASPVCFCWQSVWSRRLIYSYRGQIYTNYRTLTIATWVWPTQSHKGIIPSPYGTSTLFLAMTCSVLFLRSLPRLAAVCQFFFRIEQFGAIIPHFVFPPVSRLSSAPSSSANPFQNSF
jgi:hypothetical protein